MRRGRLLLVVGLAIALVVAASSAWLASSSPDGLERVAADKGFLDRAEDAAFDVLPGYSVPGIENERASTALAGVLGVVAVAGVTLASGMLLRRRADERDEPEAQPLAREHGP